MSFQFSLTGASLGAHGPCPGAQIRGRTGPGSRFQDHGDAPRPQPRRSPYRTCCEAPARRGERKNRGRNGGRRRKKERHEEKKGGGQRKSPPGAAALTSSPSRRCRRGAATSCGLCLPAGLGSAGSIPPVRQHRPCRPARPPAMREGRAGAGSGLGAAPDPPRPRLRPRGMLCPGRSLRRGLPCERRRGGGDSIPWKGEWGKWCLLRNVRG